MNFRPVNRQLMVAECDNPNGLQKTTPIMGPDGNPLDVRGSLHYGIVVERDRTPYITTAGSDVTPPVVADVGDVVYWKDNGAGMSTLVDGDRQGRIFIHEAEVKCVLKKGEHEVKVRDTDAVAQTEKKLKRRAVDQATSHIITPGNEQLN